MRRVRDVDGPGQHLDGRPFQPVPQVIQHADGNAAIDHAPAGLVRYILCGSIFPGAGEEEDLFAVSRRIRARQLVDVLADTGTLPQGGAVVDEDAHDGRVQSQATETQNG